MTTTDHDALINAILHHPAEDVPRLAYADWLDEHAGVAPCPVWHSTVHGGAAACPTCSGTGSVSDGRHARAEFIRVQCELAKLKNYATCLATCVPPDFEGCPNRALRRRERELLNGAPDGQEVPNRVRWLGGDNPSHLLYDAVRPVYRRGFVSEVTATLAALRADDWEMAKRLGRTCPLEKVVLTDREPTEWAREDGPADHAWIVRTPNQIDTPGDVPRELFDRLTGEVNRDGWACRYPTRAAALDDLAVACALWCRHLGGFA